MKLFKFFAIFFLLFHTTQPVSLLSPKIEFSKKMENAINSLKIKTGSIVYKEFIDQVEFDIDNCHIVLSTKKDPLVQLTTLQEAQKVAKIKQSIISFIDLSVDHPYATLKNN